MESLIVSPLLQVIFDNMASPILNKAQTGRDFKKEMKKLQETLPVIQAVMEDAEELQLKDQKIKSWLTKLRDVAYDADDLMDELFTLVLRRELVKVNSRLFVEPRFSHARKSFADHLKKLGVHTMEKLRLASFTLESIPSYFKMSSTLKEIRERLDDIAKEMSSFQFKQVVPVPHRGSHAKERREIGPYIEESEVCCQTLLSLLMSWLH